MAILAEDPNLEKMRFDLVPKMYVFMILISFYIESDIIQNNYLLFRINEESFWQNYFYRVNLICNASNLESLESTDYNTASSNVNSDLTGN